ncbi:hypothetical protein [Leptolyngbya sp. FACHB-16]|uniref:hypothetical protein n=1 Tax=unclassified Leptolyngbya TaxID=2650499 RepID=UPI0016837C4A|nr:hypothetical protein [Leptolyngbya sp. FACHB-16]MBD1913050.1 hypothetical protein [Leptolyngbya sp. FACHB-8]MBD2154449.1 hypothetical protein [Leptolyngbya sp. FACHB-16]
MTIFLEKLGDRFSSKALDIASTPFIARDSEFSDKKYLLTFFQKIGLIPAPQIFSGSRTRFSLLEQLSKAVILTFLGIPEVKPTEAVQVHYPLHTGHSDLFRY